MGTELKKEDILMQVKSKLQSDDVKLWMPPYYLEDSGPSDVEIENLSRQYSESLNISYNNSLYAIRELQEYAIEKLKERDRYKDTGIATLKIRISSDVSGTNIINVELRLDVKSLDLKNEVASRIDTGPNRFKLIASGKVLVDDNNLQSQGVRNGSQIMVVFLHDNPNEIREVGIQMNEIESVKADTNLLASKSDNYYMNLEDQFGNAINLPPQERKSILVAMALHEKGRTALKKAEYSMALVMFLDADKEFSQCNSSILESVDNYALLNLDIVWCYLCLKSISQIPEAEDRLQRCERNFIRSYGKDLERLIALKGTPGNESALFMRLHLLQAIVKYHQNERPEALKLLLQAEDELKMLKVDETSILALVELGYSVAEARLGLRATQGNVNAAAEYINTNREKRSQSRKEALEEWVLNKERYKLGKCTDGKQYVEPRFVEMMESMGYPKETARLALQQSNNNVSLSVQIIQDNPHLLNVAGTSTSQSMTQIIADMTPQLEAAGFNIAAVKLALKKHKGDVLKAIDDLLLSGGVIEDSSEESINSRSSRDLVTKQKEQEAFERLTQAISTTDDDHLDLTLEQEEMFLYQYKSLLDPK